MGSTPNIELLSNLSISLSLRFGLLLTKEKLPLLHQYPTPLLPTLIINLLRLSINKERPLIRQKPLMTPDCVIPIEFR